MVTECLAILLPAITKNIESELGEFIDVLRRFPGRVMKVPINFVQLWMIMYKKREMS